MNFDAISKMSEQYLTSMYQKNKTQTAVGSIGFYSALSTKATEKTEGMSFKEMLKSKYPKAYYNVMDTSKIDAALWGRTDYPFDKYFKEPADQSVLDWKPTGPQPPMLDPKVQAKIGSTLGKTAIVIPPELEEKMNEDPELAKKVMERIDNFIGKYYRPGANQGFLITFDENGEINHSCITSESFSVSSSEYKDAQRARREKRAQYERIAEAHTMEQKLLQKKLLAAYEAMRFFGM